MSLPFSYKVSNAINITVEEEADHKTIVLEFRFADYRLELDDPQKAKILLRALQQALGEKPKSKEKVELPDFYGGDK